MIQSKIAEIVSLLKKVREENGLTFQRIYDLVEESGGHVSLSTIKRVFETGSESYGFQYEGTLKPIADAVLSAYSPPDAAAEDVADTMRAIIEYKSLRIRDLENQLTAARASYKRRLAFLTQQINLKDDRIDHRDAMIEKLVDTVIHRPNCPHCSSCGGGKHGPGAKHKPR